MTKDPAQRLALNLNILLNRIYKYISAAVEHGQPFGACLVNPKYSTVKPPTNEIQKQLEERATNHFLNTKAKGYYLKYSTLPLSPINANRSTKDDSTVDDYQITLEHPEFDERWQQTTASRALLFCMHDNEGHSWEEWFELQLEAIRLTPLLHQSLNEAILLHRIEFQLHSPLFPFFENFIYEYALNDKGLALSQIEKESLRDRKITWQSLYPSAANTLKPGLNLIDGYRLIHKKVVSIRSGILKPLWWGFLQWIDNKLINHTALPDDLKSVQIERLRIPKKRPSKTAYQAKRPAIVISDLECAQVLYSLVNEFIKAKTKKLTMAESIIFIWIAQHAAFSGLHLTVNEILSIKLNEINFEELTIQISDSEMDMSAGLKEILQAYVGNNRNKKPLFQNLCHDTLLDVLAKITNKLYGEKGKLSPRDLLEKVHVIPGLRIPVETRRLIDKQAALIKNSPYRIKPSEIKKDIKRAIREQQSHI